MHAPSRVVGERDVGRLFSRLTTFLHMKAILELANQGRSDVCETICRSDSPHSPPMHCSNVHTQSVRSSNQATLNQARTPTQTNQDNADRIYE